MTISTLAQFISPFRLLLIGFSGGLDSTVLLHRLMLLRDQQPDLQLRAIHIHHGLSEHADEWVTHCRSICKKWDISLIVERVKLKKKGLGIEGEARKARYAAFSNTLLVGEALVTAQNLEDQCETLLLALKRGSGPTGLSAMRSRTDFYGTKQLRPFLNLSRISLEIWGNKHNLCWIEDESNREDNYDRNFLRLRVLPKLVDRWPNFYNATARSAQLCAEQESLIDELLADELTSAISEKGSIEISVLKNKSTVRRTALLRRWILIHQISIPSRDMLKRIWNEVVLARKDANPVLHLNGFEIRRYLGKLWLVPCLPTISNCILFWTKPMEPLTLPKGMGKISLQPGGNVRVPSESELVTVHFQAPGMLHIMGRSGGRKLKKIWQERKVPPWRRKVTPLLFYGDKLIAAAGGIFITQEGFSKTGMEFIWKT